MKVKVLRDFMDKYSEVLYKKDLTIDLPQDRVKEINSTTYGRLVEILEEPRQDETTEEPGQEKTTEEPGEEKHLTNMTKAELQEIAKERNIAISSKDTKEMLVSKIKEALKATNQPINEGE